MVKVNELRIGNYLTYKNPFMKDFELAVVDSILSDGLMEGINYDFESEEYIKLYEINPIPLTEEWLIKFGFKKLMDGVIMRGYIDKFLLIDCERFLNGEYEVYLKTIESGFSKGTGYKYVHQLQNMYFALTGEELTLNK